MASDSLCERHRSFVPLIAALEHAEEEVGESSRGSSRLLLHARARGLHEELAHGLIPHAVGEGRTVFPVLRRVTGSDRASREMTDEHRRIAVLADELERAADELTSGGPPSSRERALHEVLNELRSAVRDHFEEEEAACFEILKGELSPEEAREMYEAMEQAAANLRRAYE